MKPTRIFRTGGFFAATCCALVGGPAAIASAQPTQTNNRVAPTTPGKATADASLIPNGFQTAIHDGAVRRLQLLVVQQAKLQQSTVKIESAEKAKLAQERDALVAAKTASDAAHLQATASNQQWLQAVSGIVNSTGGITGLTALGGATRTAEKADAAALQAQIAANGAAWVVGMQTQVDTLTVDLLNHMAAIQQAKITAESHIVGRS